ncbi:HesA/MoeB/ThiF family protein [Methanocorpusculum sp. MG]|uniref:HesA/MoeB/ThiF family protein n=1 Tax=Methanocorpusculum petauri TaxID=3002863 RepID=A0ABT4IIJ5_9EURY|nr:HesA/MoeB/ThiF family protein [Methanocorpusculum petauri]MCZ0861575.1 HesA/MoeB/ThiF family protein [Methanocorpusculum petauri]MDE2444459.1 HesA/MoeB/ThiF family protein [Methanocorpusculum sp.]
MNERYARQIPVIGTEGQKKLQNATVFLAGCGGLGSPVAFYLAAAGVGHLRIADCDIVDATNLNRQILHRPDRIGMPKAASAKLTLEAFNPDIEITAFASFIDEKTAPRMIGDADIIVDAMDNFTARYILNEMSQTRDIPLMHGGVAGLNGQATLIIPKKTACLSCIFPDAHTTTGTPILGAAAGIIGSIEAEETIKYLTGTGETLAGKLLLWDGAVNRMDVFSVKKSRRCPICSPTSEETT